MKKDQTYRKDVVLGTWVAVALFLLTGFAALMHFEQLTTRPEPVSRCEICVFTGD